MEQEMDTPKKSLAEECRDLDTQDSPASSCSSDGSEGICTKCYCTPCSIILHGYLLKQAIIKTVDFFFAKTDVDLEYLVKYGRMAYTKAMFPCSMVDGEETVIPRCVETELHYQITDMHTHFNKEQNEVTTEIVLAFDQKTT